MTAQENTKQICECGHKQYKHMKRIGCTNCEECKKFVAQNQSQDKTGITGASDIVTGSFGSSSPDTRKGIFDVSYLDMDMHSDRIRFTERQRLKAEVEKVLDEWDKDLVDNGWSIKIDIKELKKKLGII